MTFDRLTVNGGKVRLAGFLGASLLIQALVMNGGVIEPGKSMGPCTVVLLGTRFEATSTATQTATISAGGAVVFAVRPELIVNNGPQPIDLSIESGIRSVGNFGLQKSGPGVARFTRDNIYTGETTVAAGTLLISGNQLSSAVGVESATLGGIGTVAGIFAVPGATIAPGASAGVLRSALAVTLAEGSTFTAEILSATSFDQLAVTGAVTLNNPTLGLTLANGITLPVNTTFKIIDNDAADAVSGTFANLPEGASLIVDRYTFAVSHRGGDGNDVVLTVTDVRPDVLTYYLSEGATRCFLRRRHTDRESQRRRCARHADVPAQRRRRHDHRASHRAEAGAAGGARRSDQRARERLTVGAGHLRRQAAAHRRANLELVDVGRDAQQRRRHRHESRQAREALERSHRFEVTPMQTPGPSCRHAPRSCPDRRGRCSAAISASHSPASSDFDSRSGRTIYPSEAY